MVTSLDFGMSVVSESELAHLCSVQLPLVSINFPIKLDQSNYLIWKE